MAHQIVNLDCWEEGFRGRHPLHTCKTVVKDCLGITNDSLLFFLHLLNGRFPPTLAGRYGHVAGTHERLQTGSLSSMFEISPINLNLQVDHHAGHNRVDRESSLTNI